MVYASLELETKEDVVDLDASGTLTEPEHEAQVPPCYPIEPEILVEESTVQLVESSVTVCGDIHGHSYDLRELFKVR